MLKILLLKAILENAKANVNVKLKQILGMYGRKLLSLLIQKIFNLSTSTGI